MKAAVRNSKFEGNPNSEARFRKDSGARAVPGSQRERVYRSAPIYSKPVGISSALRARDGSRSADAFTLIELLVVIAIIAILAAIAMPTISMFKPNPLAAASRQLLDDLNYARHRALSDHTTVYVVFMPAVGNLNQQTSLWNSPVLPNSPGGINATIQQRMIKGQYTAYALYERRQIGDQPGRRRAHWLTNWRYLPKGTFIAPQKFGPKDQVAPAQVKLTGYWPFDFMTFNYGSVNTNADDGPFFTDPENPNHATSYSQMPFIAFDYRGSLVGPWEGWRGPDPYHGAGLATNNVGDCVIPLTQGIVNVNTNPLPIVPPNPVENPPNGWTNIPGYNLLVIDGPTGRARVERAQVQ